MTCFTPQLYFDCSPARECSSLPSALMMKIEESDPLILTKAICRLSGDHVGYRPLLKATRCEPSLSAGPCIYEGQVIDRVSSRHYFTPGFAVNLPTLLSFLIRLSCQDHGEGA